MKNISLVFLLIFTLFYSVSAFTENSKLIDLANNSISVDKKVSSNAIVELRKLNQQGLDILLGNFANQTKAFEATGENNEKWKQISDAIDSVSMQKDAFASKLYWFTDLDLAKLEAKKQNKPILSLRLLGNLNEEFSCANSRFFRSILYSNSEISSFLRKNYILHWKSVRPAPKVTIDFGDGRKIERTLTGNSIHYILDEQGRTIDALPGLYSPSVFLSYLAQAKEVIKIAQSETQKTKGITALSYRKAKFNEIIAKRDAALKQSGVKLVESKESYLALEISPLAMTKMVTEASILRDINDGFIKFTPNIAISDWKKLSSVYATNTKIDDASAKFISRQNSSMSQTELKNLLSNTETYISLDTTQNEFVFHTQLYSWLNSGLNEDLEKLNTKIYDKIFRTPNSDKWLGLYSTDIYTALDGNGIVNNFK